MYDAKSEAREFVGEHREEAIAKACEFFGVDEDALAIGEFAAGTVRGLGSRFLIVGQLRHARTRRLEPSGAAQAERRSERRGEGGPRGDRQRRAGGRGGGGQTERAAQLLSHTTDIVAELNTWGWWHSQEGRLQVAANAYRTSLALKPDQPEVQSLLAALESQ